MDVERSRGARYAHPYPRGRLGRDIDRGLGGAASRDRGRRDGRGDRVHRLPAAASKLRETLAPADAVASPLSAFLDGVNQRGTELVCDLHWLPRVIAGPTWSPESLRRLQHRTRRPLARLGLVNRRSCVKLKEVTAVYVAALVDL